MNELTAVADVETVEGAKADTWREIQADGKVYRLVDRYEVKGNRMDGEVVLLMDEGGHEQQLERWPYGFTKGALDGGDASSKSYEVFHRRCEKIVQLSGGEL